MENRLLTGIILLTGFIMAVSAASLYAQSHILSGTACGCSFPIELLIPMLSSAGVLVGSLTYYFMSSHLKSKKDLSPLMALLDTDQRAVIQALAKAGGSLPQSRLVSETGLNKVKVSRIVADLEGRGVVKKEASGITNTVELEEMLKKALA